MSSTSSVENVSLSRIIDTVEGHGQTLTLYNLTVSQDVVEPIADHFEVTSVSLRKDQTKSSVPTDFAVLHENEEFIAASDVTALSQAVDIEGPFMQMEDAPTERPALLNEVDQSVFTEYGKRRMILASRDIEQRAWRQGAQELHVGFQEFSRLQSQLELYRRLTEKVSVHLYGVPDWEPPLENIHLHGYQTDEIRNHWFVVYDSADDNPVGGAQSLLAQEREPNVYQGFWSSHQPIADHILTRLRTEYPVTQSAP